MYPSFYSELLEDSGGGSFWTHTGNEIEIEYESQWFDATH